MIHKALARHNQVSPHNIPEFTYWNSGASS